MKNEMNDQRIQDYLDGRLSGKELSDFNKEVESSNELKQFIKELQGLDHSLKSLGAEHLMNDLKTWEAGFQEKQGYAKYWVMGIAASIALLIVASIYFSNRGQSNINDLYVEYFVPYEDFISSRSEFKEGDLIQGMKAYNKKHYSEAAELLQMYLDSNPGHDHVYLYLGLAYLQINQFEEAEKSFKRVFNQDNYKEQGEWYLALLYLKWNKIEELNYLLDTVIEQNNHYKKNDAVNLKTKLRYLPE